jgi:ABC-type branched-subunit amino acid transport system substrate-binding protein
MGRRVRIFGFVSLLVLVVAACGSRVVPLDVNAFGQPITTGTTGPSANPTTQTTSPTGGPIAGGTGGGSRSGPLANCKAPSGSTDKGVTQTSIKVGLIAAITGSFRGQFNANIEAVDAYFKMINAEEGGICGRKIQLTIKDDQGSAQQNLNAARELADDVGVFAFVGSVSAPDSDTGVASVSRAQKIPDIGFPLTYLRSKSPYTFGVPGQLAENRSGEGQSGTKYLNKLHGIKQVAVFWVGEALVSKANAWVFQASALRNSGEPPTVKICYERETSVLDNNFDNYAAAMAQACGTGGGPLAIYSTMENNSNIKLARAIRSQGVKHEYFAPTFTSYLQSYVKDESGNPRSETEGSYIAVPQIPFERCGFDSKGRPVPPCSHPELNRYVTALSRYRPGYIAPGSWGAPGWGEAALFVEAAKACGARLTRACVISEINKINDFSVNGFLSPTTPREHVIYTTDLILQVRNGKFVEIRPNDKSGPREAPDFWDKSQLYNWWTYFCSHQQHFPSRDDIRGFVRDC